MTWLEGFLKVNTPLEQLYEALFQHYGAQHWWPGETAFEVCVGAILTQNTNWSNVEKAIERLKVAGRLELAALAELPADELGELIRPSGTFRVKARRLSGFVEHVRERYDGQLDWFFDQPVDALRAELLSINGIGRETADSIALYAAGKLTFVVDAYTYRILARHELVEQEIEYEGLKEYCQENLPAELELYQESHALLVAVGKQFCRPKPRCEQCPLRQHLAEGRYEELMNPPPEDW